MERVAEKWMNKDESDVGYQELSYDEIICEILDYDDIESEENSENENDENT